MKSPRPMILIAGGGIGGLTPGATLEQSGIEYEILEQAAEMKEVGAGIQLSANCVRILERLGLGAAMADIGVLPQTLEIRGGLDGVPILTTALGIRARKHFGAPYYHAHRADLQQALLDRIERSRLRLGRVVTGFDQTPDRVTVELADRAPSSGDVLVGADGIHSVVRQTMFGPDRPRFSGLKALRGLLDGDRARTLGVDVVSGVWWGPGKSMVHYYVSSGRLLNWIGIVETSVEEKESWSTEGQRSEALHHFQGWQPQIVDMIRSTETLFESSLYDRDPLPRWIDGRVALLGDAAPMLPFHAQGAAMSIEDAYVLGKCLQRRTDDLEAGLRIYQELRLERANWVQRYSREAAGFFHLSDPDLRQQRDEKLRYNQSRYPTGFPRGQERIYGYDADAALEARFGDSTRQGTSSSF